MLQIMNIRTEHITKPSLAVIIGKANISPSIMVPTVINYRS